MTAPGTYKASTETSVIWDNLASGTHTFGVQLVNNDHVPLEPPVTATVTVTVTPSVMPSLRIIMPKDGSTVRDGSIEVSVEVANFNLVSPGGANVLGEGHIHYYLDVEIPTTPGAAAVTDSGTYKATTETVVTWDNVGLGTHTLGVQLVNSDHTPLEPPIIAEVTVKVTAPAEDGGADGGY